MFLKADLFPPNTTQDFVAPVQLSFALSFSPAVLKIWFSPWFPIFICCYNDLLESSVVSWKSTDCFCSARIFWSFLLGLYYFVRTKRRFVCLLCSSSTCRRFLLLQIFRFVFSQTNVIILANNAIITLSGTFRNFPKFRNVERGPLKNKTGSEGQVIAKWLRAKKKNLHFSDFQTSSLQTSKFWPLE